MILVDTNVLLDLITDDPAWAAWSQQQLEAASLQDRLAINPVIYAELSVGYERIEALDAMLDLAAIAMEPVPRAALFLAGKAFQNYRRTAGTKTGILPDFFIGAHAAVAQAGLLTRDPTRYARYFPSIRLITP